MKKVLIVTNSEGMYEMLDSYEKNKTLELKYSELDKCINSNYQGKTLATLLNEGNGVTISLNNKILRLDFCEVEELLTLLLYESETDGRKFTYKKAELKEC
jgi:hypothetical protein